MDVENTRSRRPSWELCTWFSWKKLRKEKESTRWEDIADKLPEAVSPKRETLLEKFICGRL